MIKLGVDARLLNGKLVGVSRYIYEMIKEFQNYHIKIYLISNKDILFPEDFKNDDNFIKIEDKSFRLLPGSIWMQLRVNKICIENNIDVFWGTQFILPIIKNKNIKYILTVHDLVFKLYPNTMQFSGWLFSKLFFKRSLIVADKIITVSNNTKNELLYFYNNLNLDIKTTTIYHGRRDILCNYKEPYAFDYILALGSIEPRKNLISLVKCFECISKKLPNLKLVLAGGKGWKNSELHNYIDENKLNDKIIFTGYVSDIEIENLFSNTSLFVFPSLYEGFGMPLIESQNKCLIACSDIPVFRELSVYFENLYVCDFENDLKATAGILTALITKNKSDRLVSYLKSGTKDIFTWENASKQFMQEIKSII